METALMVMTVLMGAVLDCSESGVVAGVALDAVSRTDNANGHDGRAVYDVLVSIEEKLRSLDTISSTLQLSRIQYALDQLGRRLDSIDHRVSRLETKLDSGFDRISEAADRHGSCREKTLMEHVSRKMDATTEKIYSKVGLLETKSTIQIENVAIKVERLDRHVSGALDDMLEKVAKVEERYAQQASQWTLKLERIEDSGQVIQDLMKEELVGFISKHVRELGNEVEEGFQKLSEAQRCKVVQRDVDLARSSNRSKSDVDRLENQWAATSADTPSSSPSFPSNWNNFTATLTDTILMGEKKLQELDGDIEIYTRKVLNTYQELLKESKEIEAYLNDVMDHNNQTRMVVREGFRKLYQQIKPISNLEEVLQSLHKKVVEMGSTVDNSFASLLVAQNTFISTCHRVQQQEPLIETKIYLLLQRLLKETEEKAQLTSDGNGTLWKAFEMHRKDVGRALHDLVWTVITVGNQTIEDLKQVLGKESHNASCCQCKSDLSALEDGGSDYDTTNETSTLKLDEVEALDPDALSENAGNAKELILPDASDAQAEYDYQDNDYSEE